MKRFILALIVSLVAGTAFAQEHHVKHGMVLVGTKEIFAAHIVNKAPHNWQIILQVEFDNITLAQYTAYREQDPSATYILVLDPMDIRKISVLQQISGTIIRKLTNGQEQTVARNVVLHRDDYEVLFSKELPL